MTTFILHGGNAQNPGEKNDKFFSEILHHTKKNPSILLVHFAGRPEKAEINKTKDTNQFLRACGNNKVNITVASEKHFINQIHANDVIYLGGGTTTKLLLTLKKYPNFGDEIKNKVIAGESAGANVLSKYAYSKSAGGVIKCLAVLNINIVPHYNGTEEKELENINNPAPETVLLKEQEYTVIKK